MSAPEGSSPDTAGPGRRVLIRWVDGLDAAARRRTLASVLADRAELPARERISDHVDALDLAPSGADPRHLDGLIDALIARPEVVVVERDRLLPTRTAGTTSPAPDDPLFASQWGLHNPGEAVGADGQPAQGTVGIDVRILETWGLTRGEPTVQVAVIDTAVDLDHRDLAGAVTDEVTTLEESSSPGLHGSAVAGIIGARADDGFGVAGVAPEVSMVSAAAFETLANGLPGGASLSAVLEAFEVAAASGADVINASWVTSDASPLLEDAIVSSGIPVVAATGNDGLLLSSASDVYPVGFDLPNVVAVTALDRVGAVAPFANVGPNLVDVAAPGVDVLAPGVDDQHVWANGTSFAAPHVSGALALAKGTAPYATTDELIDAVSWTSRVLPGLAASTRTGGMLDAAALVRGVQRPVCRPDRLEPADFPDVTSTDVHRVGIDCLAAERIAAGRADGTFGPDAPVTREQLATFLARILETYQIAVDAPPAGFSDVDPGSVHAPAIDVLSDLGIVLGDEQGRFRPRHTVTRGQMASLLVRTHAELTGTAHEPSRSWFHDTADSVHAAGIDRGRDLGIIRGVTRVSFDPEAPTRRGQMASFLARTLDALEREGEGAG